MPNKHFEIIEFPIEGKLILYYASNLVINGNYNLAIRVLENYGLKYFMKGKRGLCNKANVQKILALAYYHMDTNFEKIEELLIAAHKHFKHLKVHHGMAVTCFSKAYLFFTKSTEFRNEQRNEDQVIKMALKECEEAFTHYGRFKHKNG